MPRGSEAAVENEALRRRVGRSEAARIVGLAFWIDSMVVVDGPPSMYLVKVRNGGELAVEVGKTS